MTPRELGRLGEDLAARHLTSPGVDRAGAERAGSPEGRSTWWPGRGTSWCWWRCGPSPCDRTQGAADTVGPEKLRRLVRAGRTYVALRGYDGFWRIDLVALDRTPSGWNLTHLRDLTAGRIEGRGCGG